MGLHFFLAIDGSHFWPKWIQESMQSVNDDMTFDAPAMLRMLLTHKMLFFFVWTCNTQDVICVSMCVWEGDNGSSAHTHAWQTLGNNVSLVSNCNQARVHRQVLLFRCNARSAAPYSTRPTWTCGNQPASSVASGSQMRLASPDSTRWLYGIHICLLDFEGNRRKLQQQPQ